MNNGIRHALEAFRTRRARIETEDKWQGDNISSPKDSKCTRIMFHNIRHLSLHGTAGVEMFLNAQASLQVDVQAFSEHCLDTTKFQVVNTAKEILRSTFSETATLQLNSSTEPAQNQYKPGGTGIAILGPVAGRLEPQGKGGDPMGRWSFTTLRRRNLPPLTILSVYQVCPRPTNIIGNTAYHQQQRALNKAGRSIHPRRAFIDDLSQFIADLSTQQHDIILGGDFNESVTDRNSGLLHLATAHNMIDPFLHRFPHHPEFGTHLQGSRRIDVVLVTPRILDSIKTIGYAPFEYATTSDHRPLLLEFHTDILFGARHTDLLPAHSRGVRVKDTKSVETFITHLYNELMRSEVWTIQAQLDADTATPWLVEQLDEIVGKCEEAAEHKCRRRRPEFYSRTIVKQRIEVSILKSHLQALKMNRDRSTILQQKMRRTGVFVQLPETQTLTRASLTAARQRLAETKTTSHSVRQTELAQDIQDASQDRDSQKQKRLKAIKTAEQNTRTYHILQAMRKAQDITQKLDQVEIPASWPPSSQELQSTDQLEDPKTCQEWR